MSLQKVFENEYLANTIVEYLVKRKLWDTLLISSPILPLLLSIRPVFMQWQRELTSKYADTESPRIKSIITDFIENASLVQWAINEGCNFYADNDYLCRNAARNNYIETLQWACGS